MITGVLLLTGLVTTVAAAPATRIACGQCEEADRFVRLQAVTTDDRPVSSQRFTHPFVLSPEDWKSILTELHVQHQAKELLVPVPEGLVMSAFTEEEITYLSVTLSKAFAQAQSNEWVVFGLSRAGSHGLTKLTTGGWYVDGPALHVVLANYREAVTMSRTRQLLWERPLHPNTGSSYNFVAGNHQTIVRKPSSVLSLLTSSPSELVIAYQALLLKEPGAAPVSQETSAVNQSPARSPRIVPPSFPIEERLQVLKRLQTQGLITEEEYRAKKQQLLDRF
jgi:hypothetical protein